MFFLELDNDLLYLNFVDEKRGINLQCNPQDLNCLTEEDDGYDSSPSNGEFCFYKKDNKYVFYSAKYGCGQAGQ